MAKVIAKPIALAIAAGITLGGSFGAGAPAFAQDGTVPSVAEEATQVLPHASTIEDSSDYSLTLHKRLNAKTPGESTAWIQSVVATLLF